MGLGYVWMGGGGVGNGFEGRLRGGGRGRLRNLKETEFGKGVFECLKLFE